MKRLLAALLIFCSSLAFGAACDGTAVCNQTTNTKYATVQSAVSAMSAGDVVVVYKGDYPENVTISAGTSTSAYKTVQANVVTLTGTVTLTNGSPTVTGVGTSFNTQVAANDWVSVSGFVPVQVLSVQSATTMTLTANWYAATVSGQTMLDAAHVLSFSTNSFTRIIGFNILNPSSPSTNRCVTIANGSQWVWITDNRMSACSTVRTNTSTGAASQVYIQRNLITYFCTTPTSSPITTCEGVLATGDHWLIEQNEFSHLSDAANTVDHTVFRDNYLHDFLESECVSGGVGGNCHFDMAQEEPVGLNYKYVLAEGNYGGNNEGGHDTGQGSFGNGHGFLMQGDSCPAPSAGDPFPCAYYIARFNSFVHFANGPILDQLGSKTNAMGFSHVKTYNNTWVDFNFYNATSGTGSAFTYYSSYGAAINELFYYPQALTSFNPYICDGRSGFGATCDTFKSSNNLAYCSVLGSTPPGSCVLYGLVYTQGTFATASPNNKVADPKFVTYTPGSTNWAGNDFHLQSSSPAKEAGTNLTTVATGGGGTGVTSITVQTGDGAFFQDSYGLTGVLPDGIACGTVSNRATITSIVGDVLYLDRSITCADNSPVWLASNSHGVNVLTGAAPNIGAFGTGATSPYTISIAGSGSGTGTVTGDDSMNCTSTAGILTGTCLEGHNSSDTPTYTASASVGTFVGWSVSSGATVVTGCGTASTCKISVSGNATVSASFSIVPTLALSCNSSVYSVVANSTLSCTLTASNFNQIGGNWSMKSSAGTVITNISGKPVSCGFDSLTDFCGTQGGINGTFTITFIPTLLDLALMQPIWTVSGSAGAIPSNTVSYAPFNCCRVGGTVTQ